MALHLNFQFRGNKEGRTWRRVPYGCNQEIQGVNILQDGFLQQINYKEEKDMSIDFNCLNPDLNKLNF